VPAWLPWQKMALADETSSPNPSVGVHRSNCSNHFALSDLEEKPALIRTRFALEAGIVVRVDIRTATVLGNQAEATVFFYYSVRLLRMDDPLVESSSSALLLDVDLGGAVDPQAEQFRATIVAARVH
jgi:hypothetical protein